MHQSGCPCDVCRIERAKLFSPPTDSKLSPWHGPWSAQSVHLQSCRCERCVHFGVNGVAK